MSSPYCTVNVRYTNGTGANSSHSVSVNGGSASSITYPGTVGWGRYRWAQLTATLNAGNNTIRLTYSGTYAELDMISVYQASAALPAEFRITNRSSAKYLEIAGGSTADGAGAVQYSFVASLRQVWQIATSSGSYFYFTNKKQLEVPGDPVRLDHRRRPGREGIQ